MNVRSIFRPRLFDPNNRPASSWWPVGKFAAICSAMAAMTLGAFQGLLAQVDAGAEKYPYSIDDIKQATEILSLKSELGFLKLTTKSSQQLQIILDPRLDEKNSSCYAPTAASPEGQSTPKKTENLEQLMPAMFQKTNDNLIIGTYVKNVLKDFFKNVYQGEANYRPNLQNILLSPPKANEFIPLITVATHFTISHNPEDSLECHLKLRMFRIKLDQLPSGEAVNISHCELIFQDAAEGRVPLNHFSGMDAHKKLVQASVIQALRNRVAMNLCLNQRIQKQGIDKLSSRNILGDSISEYQKTSTTNENK